MCKSVTANLFSLCMNLLCRHEAWLAQHFTCVQALSLALQQVAVLWHGWLKGGL